MRDFAHLLFLLSLKLNQAQLIRNITSLPLHLPRTKVPNTPLKDADERITTYSDNTEK
jgi:hypothetical protein